MDEKY